MSLVMLLRCAVNFIFGVLTVGRGVAAWLHRWSTQAARA